MNKVRTKMEKKEQILKKPTTTIIQIRNLLQFVNLISFHFI